MRLDLEPFLLMTMEFSRDVKNNNENPSCRMTEYPEQIYFQEGLIL